MMMAGVHEVGSGVHRTVRRRHRAVGIAGAGIATIGSGCYTVGATATDVTPSRGVATTGIATNSTTRTTFSIAHGCVITAADLGRNAARARLVAAAA